MTESRSPDNRIRAWLELMPVDAPDRVIDAVLHAAATTAQVRPSLAAAWRASRMNRFAQLAAATLVGAAIVGGGVLLAGGKATQPAPSAQPTSTAPASSAPSSSLPEALFGTWMTSVNPMDEIGNGGGPIRLTISNIGTPTLAIDNLQPGARFGSVHDADGANQLTVTLAQPDNYCLTAGVAGTYQWAMSQDRSRLTLTALGDPCHSREITIARSWVRSLTASTSIGAGVVDAFEPFFSVVLPDGAYGSRNLTDWVSIARSDGLSLSVWKNPVGFADLCDQVRVAYKPGVEAFVTFFEQNAGFKVVSKDSVTVGGLPAVHLVVEGLQSPCADGGLLQFTPVNCDCHWVSGPGVVDSFYAIDVSGDTIVVSFAPAESGVAEAPVIESIGIPASYPQ